MAVAVLAHPKLPQVAEPVFMCASSGLAAYLKAGQARGEREGKLEHPQAFDAFACPADAPPADDQDDNDDEDDYEEEEFAVCPHFGLLDGTDKLHLCDLSSYPANIG